MKRKTLKSTKNQIIELSDIAEMLSKNIKNTPEGNLINHNLVYALNKCILQIDALKKTLVDEDKVKKLIELTTKLMKEKTTLSELQIKNIINEL